MDTNAHIFSMEFTRHTIVLLLLVRNKPAMKEFVGKKIDRCDVLPNGVKLNKYLLLDFGFGFRKCWSVIYIATWTVCVSVCMCVCVINIEKD